MNFKFQFFIVVYILGQAMTVRGAAPEDTRAPLNPLLWPVIDPSNNRYMSKPQDFFSLIQIFQELLLRDPAELPEISEPVLDEVAGAEARVPTSPLSQNEIFAHLDDILYPEGTLEIEMACNRQKKYDFLGTAQKLETRTQQSFNFLVLESKKSFLLEVFPEGTSKLPLVFPPQQSHPLEKYRQHIVEKISGLVDCVHAAHPSVLDYRSTFRSLLDRLEAAGEAQLASYAANLKDLVSLVQDLPGQFARGIQGIIDHHLQTQNFDVNEAVGKVEMLIESHNYLTNKFAIEKSPDYSSQRLETAHEEIVQIFSKAFQTDLQGPSPAESFLIQFFVKVLEALRLQMPAQENLHLFWRSFLAKDRKAKTGSTPKAVEELEQRLNCVTKVSPTEKTLVVTLGTELFVLNHESESTSKYGSWMLSYLSSLPKIISNYGLVTVQLAAASKILLANFLPVSNKASVEEGGRLRRIALEFLRKEPELNRKVQEFPRLFDEYLDAKYLARDKDVVKIYPFAKLFNLWAANAVELLPHIAFKVPADNSQAEADVADWFAYLAAQDEQRTLKKFLVSLQVSPEAALGVKNWNDPVAMRNLIATEISWEAARFMDDTLSSCPAFANPLTDQIEDQNTRIFI